MESEFITIAEAARFLNKTDADLMRLLKDLVQSSGVSMESIFKKEQREKGVMLLVNKEFLLNTSEATPEKAEKAKPEADELLAAKDETISILQKIVETKDQQMEGLARKIDELIERDRETNILLKGLQDRIFLLEEPREKKTKNPA